MRSFVFTVVIGLGGLAILISLAAWQVQRLDWKTKLIAEIEAEIHAEPVRLIDAVDPDQRRYAPVTIAGVFGESHVRVLASRKSIGPVYRVIRPFDAEGYGRILVDLGWIRDQVPVPDAPKQRVTLRGNLDMPHEVDSFTPAPDRAANIWFAREVNALATDLSTEPVLVVLSSIDGADLGITPWPVDTSNIPNDHLQYAITWSSLALIWAGMNIFFLRQRFRQQPPKKV
jgi:surfeit locus 1 family protein